jgi:transposase
MSTKMQVAWRRTKVVELLSKGDSQFNIAKMLQVDLSIISRDVYFRRHQPKLTSKYTLMKDYQKNTRDVWLG